jgi:hypothetical protein
MVEPLRLITVLPVTFTDFSGAAVMAWLGWLFRREA